MADYFNESNRFISTVSSAIFGWSSLATTLKPLLCVSEGAAEAEIVSNIIGGSTNSKFTGMKALLSSKALLGILGVTGLGIQAMTAAWSALPRSRGFIYASGWDCVRS
ncbi:hypothetical protein JQR88_24885 (plasmid) [Pseudomonas luteola]|uniref:hypothetical protein n=1 Tax=Pseudomonas luteola TaxID=47886 RepID=UPI003DA0EEEF